MALSSGRFAALLLAGAAVWGVARLHAGTPPPFQRAWWYWHHPFRLSQAEVTSLRNAQCRRLYVHAGTLEPRAGKLTLTSRQRWESPPPCELYAVVRVHPASHPLLLGAEGSDTLAGLLQSARLPAAVRGVQLDADIPTAQLGAYAAALRRLRSRLPQAWSLSVTALPDWLRSRDYPHLCAAVDEIAPQFYGNQWPEAGKKPPPLWETDDLLAQVQRSTAGRARVWVGLPAYGRCLLLDPRGRPIGVRHDLSPAPLLADSGWSVAAAESRGDAVPVEDTLALRSERDTLAGPMAVAAGSSLWFQWPRAGAVESVTREIEALRLPGVAGACYFRWPAPDEPLRASISASPLSLAVSVQRAGAAVVVTVVNRGGDAPLLPEGVRVEVGTGGGEVASAWPVEYRLGNEPCSPLRADRVVLSRPLLRPGDRWEACRIVDPRGPVEVNASWRDATRTERLATAQMEPAALVLNDAGRASR